MRRSLTGACLLGALFSGLPTWADVPADQLERARLLREFQAPSPAASSEAANKSLPAAALKTQRLQATERFRARQFEDAQWRKLIGDQQMHAHRSSPGAAAESQWRGQTFERDRQAQNLSAQILRGDLEYRTAIRR
ncbi:MAG: hypothetical protein H7X76_05410 [Prolixibacteraceae bacterium]|nr:hypothetical protein [Burkholderiales bacterium]